VVPLARRPNAVALGRTIRDQERLWRPPRIQIADQVCDGLWRGDQYSVLSDSTLVRSFYGPIEPARGSVRHFRQLNKYEETALDALYIPRKKTPVAEGSFDGLKRSGISLLQDLAGELWTDYNEHDPGVTILEQLCYALTDVIFRSEFPVADFLVDAEGSIDWKRQCLLTPEVAFPCRPMTAFDYRAVLLDKFPEIQGIEFEVVTRKDGSPTGLYKIRVSVKSSDREQQHPQQSAEQHHESLKRKILHEYGKIRNLCEDLSEGIDSIETVTVKDYPLRGRVEIREDADPAEVLANIYVVLGDRLGKGITFTPFDEELNKKNDEDVNQKKTAEEIFRFPFIGRGVPSDHCSASDAFPVSEAFSLIKAEVPGVDDVELDEPKTHHGSQSAPATLYLHLPREGEAIPLKLFTKGRERKVSLHEFKMRYNEKSHAANRGPVYDRNSIAALLPRPEGRARTLAEYLSVQYHFPATYGLGPRGVPGSAPAERKAQILQLTAYLLLFERQMADCMASFSNLRRLYSLGINKHQTYFFQKLNEESFPGIGLVGEASAPALRKEISAPCHRDRAKRLLDYMLALYGEEFAGNFPRIEGEHFGNDDNVIEAMIAYLSEIETITRDRAAAADYTRPPGKRVHRSGLEAKLSHLLCFEKDGDLGDYGVRVIEHILLRPAKIHAPENEQEDFFSFRISVLFPGWTESYRDESFRKIAEQLIDSNCPAHIYADVYWLNQRDMEIFEELHQRWWTYRTHADEHSRLSEAAKHAEAKAELHKTAVLLVHFLKELGEKEPKA
jgi:hypothetical protein